MHLARKRRVLSLRGVADAVAFPPLDVRRETIAAFVDLFDEPAVMERVQEPEAQTLAVPRARDHVAEAQDFAARLECPENLRCVQDGLYEVRAASRFVMACPHSGGPRRRPSGLLAGRPGL